MALSPLVVAAGEPLTRRIRAGLRAQHTPGQRGQRSQPAAAVAAGRAEFWLVLIRNPLWIALTAPGRWVAGRAGGGRRRGLPGPGDAGMREPRRPVPRPPAGAVALAEPRAEPVTLRLLRRAARTRAGDDDDPGGRAR